MNHLHSIYGDLLFSLSENYTRPYMPMTNGLVSVIHTPSPTQFCFICVNLSPSLKEHSISCYGHVHAESTFSQQRENISCFTFATILEISLGVKLIDV